MVTQALWLVSISVAFGALSGTVSVITGLGGHSLSVFAVGLGVLADVTESAVLIWRFRAERHDGAVRRAGNAGRHHRLGRPGRCQRRAHRRVGYRACERFPSRHLRHRPDRRAVSLALYHALGWWWADRIAALAVAVVVAAGAWHTVPHHGSDT